MGRAGVAHALDALHRGGVLHRLGAHRPEPHGLVALMVLAVVAEAFWRAAVARKGYDAGAAAATLGVAAGNLVFGALNGIGLGAIYALAWSLAPVRWPLGDWRTWAAGLVLVEFAYYWFHRFSHTVRWMWASHAVHHTSEQMTFLSAIRLGWTNLLSAGWLVYLPLVVGGFDPRLVLGVLALDLRYQFFLHTEWVGRLGPLEWVLNTPAHHRVHHASNGPYIDKNFGGMVIVFDRLFGTFAAERADEPVRYGLAHPLASRNPFVIALGEWGRLARDVVSAPGPRAALRAAFGRPAA